MSFAVNVPNARLAIFGTTTLFSLIVLGLTAHIHAETSRLYSGYFTSAAMATAVSVLSLVSLPAMIFIDRTRKGAITSMVAVELGWVGLLWVLWLAAGALGAEAISIVFFGGCGYLSKNRSTMCQEFPAFTAFSFLSWILLLGYFGTILSLSVMSAARGNPVWFAAVSQVDFNAPAAVTDAKGQAVQVPMQHIPTQFTAGSQFAPTQYTNTGSTMATQPLVSQPALPQV